MAPQTLLPKGFNQQICNSTARGEILSSDQSLIFNSKRNPRFLNFLVDSTAFDWFGFGYSLIDNALLFIPR